MRRLINRLIDKEAAALLCSLSVKVFSLLLLLSQIVRNFVLKHTFVENSELSHTHRPGGLDLGEPPAATLFLSPVKVQRCITFHWELKRSLFCERLKADD